MFQYLICLSNKIVRLLKFIIKKLRFYLLIFKNWNFKMKIIYIILISFSTLTFVYNQFNNDIDWNLESESLIDNNEIIQVNKKKRNFSILINKYYFSVIFLNYH